jgi:hypothetical protein
MLTQGISFESLFARKNEKRRLRTAIQRRESLLVWGPRDAGKTTLIESVLAELPEAARQTCISWSGPASGKQLLAHLIGQLYERGDAFVQRKVHADTASKSTLHQWLRKQSSLRLRGLLFTASTQGKYRYFLDHCLPPTQKMAWLMKEIIYRCNTPVYFAARGCSQAEIGLAWSLYWHDGLRLPLGPLSERSARDLLEICIRRFNLKPLKLEDFRKDILCLSRHLPGSIVKMCELAADTRYHYGDQIKTKLVHLDYLMQSGPSTVSYTANSPQ